MARYKTTYLFSTLYNISSHIGLPKHLTTDVAIRRLLESVEPGDINIE